MSVVGYRVSETEVVLDIGCGIKPQTFFKPRLHICCEPHDEYVAQLRKEHAGSPGIAIIQCTAQRAAGMLRDKSVDSVFLLDLIEHLDKEDGKRLLMECERIARKEIVVFTPLGFCPQEYQSGETDAWGFHGGAWQTHRSGWMPDDFDESWGILASREYHVVNGKGERVDPPIGALWAFKTFGDGAHHRNAIEALPLVSVVTPAYNRASYLDETIQSVLSQGYPHIEYIVLDDGSKDNTREVLEKYTGRIVWETHPNMGETRTVNKGFAMAHGEIVVVVNSDDPLLPGAVSAAVAFMQSHPDILVAYPDWNYIGPNSEVTGHIQVREYDYLYMLRHHLCIPGPGAFIRRKAFELTGPRDTDFRYVADFEYWLRLGLYGKFARIPKTLATFRVHPDSASISSKGLPMAEEHIRLMDKLFSRFDLPPAVTSARSAAYGSAHLIAAIVCGAERKEAAKHVYRAARYGPRGLFIRWELIVPALLPLSVQAVLRRILHDGWAVMVQIRRIGRGRIIDKDKA